MRFVFQAFSFGLSVLYLAPPCAATSTRSMVVNLCKLAHSIVRRLVLSFLVLASSTVVHVPHSGHFIASPFPLSRLGRIVAFP